MIKFLILGLIGLMILGAALCFQEVEVQPAKVTQEIDISTKKIISN